MDRRVVVTGMGTINPLSNNVEDLWSAIKAGKSGIGPITKFDATEFPSKIAGEVKDFNPTDFMDSKEHRKMGLFTKFAVAGAVEAMKQAGLDKENIEPYRSSVILGNGIGGFEIIEDAHRVLFEKGPRRIPPMTIPKLLSNEGPGNIAIRFGFKGPAYVVTTACASATDAIGQAMNAIRTGLSEVIITGGSEAAITELGVGGFCVLKALSTKRNDDPEKACRPFDADRDGFVIAEGSGILVLEELEHAKARGANILAEIAGYGATCDAFHLTAPNSDAISASTAMSEAIQDAGLEPSDIDYINAHGTSTPTNDPLETKAIKIALGDHAYKLKVSSTKSMTGHLVGAAGGIEAIISIMAIRDQFFPGTLNLENPGEGCDLDYVPGIGVPGRIKAVLSNSLGFGGHNGTLAIKEYVE
jgi:3-oxoacyl-[acyl-carrier-protein] synthase II